MISHPSVPLPGETLPSASGELLLLLLHPRRLGDNMYYYVYIQLMCVDTDTHTRANKVLCTTVTPEYLS